MLIAVNFQVSAARHVASGDWPHFNRDPGGSRYSPLDQITVDNVASLRLAWTYSPVMQLPEESSTNEKPDSDSADKVHNAALARAYEKTLANLNISTTPGRVGLKTVPVVIKGVMYVTAGNIVTAVNASNGEEIWRYTLAGKAHAGQYGG